MGPQPRPTWDGRRFRVQINGRRYSLGTDEGRAWERFTLLYRRLKHTEPGMPVLVVVSELCEAWTRKHPGRWKSDMLEPWMRFAGRELIDSLKPDCLTRFAAWCQEQSGQHGKPWAASTIGHYVAQAATVLRWAKDEGMVDVKPDMPDLETSGYEPRDIQAADLRRIIEDLKAPKRRYASRLIRFVLAVGCRPGEARLLRWSQIRREQRIAILPKHKTRKKKKRVKTRTLYLSDEALAILDECPKTGTWIFVSRNGQPYTRAGLRSICKRMDFYPYQLRHSLAQSLVDQGVGLDDVAHILGHSSTATTRRYAEVRDVRALSALRNASSPLQLASAVPLPPPKDGAPIGAGSTPRRKTPGKRPRSKRRTSTALCPRTDSHADDQPGAGW